MDFTSSINERWKVCTLASLASCFILLLCLNNHNHGFVSFLTFGNEDMIAISSSSSMDYSHPSSNVELPRPVNQTVAVECNLFHGRWVFKPMEYPVYVESQCPFLSDQISCQRNGRPDFDYQRWSWEAHDCQIPRFNGKDMLERLRGKRVIIVGDSLNRNQWESLACLLYSVIPSSRAQVYYKSGYYKVFTAKDYNISVEFYWSPFLVQLDENQTSGTKVLRLDKIDASARHWRGADIMVFNTGHWWSHRGKFKSWDLFGYKGKEVEEMKTEKALKMALQTWERWIDHNVVPTKTRVFFRSISPEHKGKNWCYNETQPMRDESSFYTEESSFPKSMVEIVERTIMGMTTKIRYLNITMLSQHRIDAHPTVYTTKKKGIDCSHWCLPGLPDTWNRMLYASIVVDTSLASN